MQEKLERHFEKFPKVKILRAPVRQGIILNRMLGATNAKGPVLVFLDSHVDVMHGWLEPVLDRFKYESELLVTMWYLTMDRNNLKFDVYEETQPYWICGFSWNMDFRFISIKSYEGDNKTPIFEPRETPTIFGSMHAIRKDYFIKLGMYDKGKSSPSISHFFLNF